MLDDHVTPNGNNLKRKVEQGPRPKECHNFYCINQGKLKQNLLLRNNKRSDQIDIYLKTGNAIPEWGATIRIYLINLKTKSSLHAVEEHTWELKETWFHGSSLLKPAVKPYKDKAMLGTIYRKCINLSSQLTPCHENTWFSKWKDLNKYNTPGTFCK